MCVYICGTGVPLVVNCNPIFRRLGQVIRKTLLLSI